MLVVNDEVQHHAVDVSSALMSPRVVLADKTDLLKSEMYEGDVTVNLLS